MTLSAEALVTDHLDALYGLSRAWVRDPATAEELTHRTFLKAFERRAQLRSPDAARAWLIGILKREIASEFRMRDRLVAWDMETFDATPAHGPVLDLDPEALEALPMALDRLPDSARTILLLRFQQELSYEDIARALAVPLGTVMSRLHRAKQALRTQLTALLGLAPEGTS